MSLPKSYPLPTAPAGAAQSPPKRSSANGSANGFAAKNGFVQGFVQGLRALLMLVLSVGLGGCGGYISQGGAGATASVQFPQMQGRNLQKQTVNLPGYFKGAYNLVLVSFNKNQQRQINPWLAYASVLQARQERFRFYEVSAIARKRKLINWLSGPGPRPHELDSLGRSRTVEVQVKQKDFMQDLDLESDEYIQVLLVNSKGQVFWREQGRFTDQKAEVLRLKLYELLAHTPTAPSGRTPATTELPQSPPQAQ